MILGAPDVVVERTTGTKEFLPQSPVALSLDSGYGYAGGAGTRRLTPIGPALDATGSGSHRRSGSRESPC
jgi:hypothetical protein